MVERQLYFHPRSLPYFTLNGNRATVTLHYALANREPESNATFRTRRIRAIKPLEQMWKIGGSNSFARIFNRDDRLTISRRKGNADGFIARRVSNRVLDQVRHNAL